MANITISDLHPAGFDLFSSSESFLKDLSESGISINGGFLSDFAPLTSNLVPYTSGISAFPLV